MQDAELELKRLDTLAKELCLAKSVIQRKDCMLRQYECQLYQMKVRLCFRGFRGFVIIYCNLRERSMVSNFNTCKCKIASVMLS